MEADKTFGQWLREQRRARGLTLSEACKVAGFSRALLSGLENDRRRPWAEVVERIAETLMDTEAPFSERTAFVRRLVDKTVFDLNRGR